MGGKSKQAAVAVLAASTLAALAPATAIAMVCHEANRAYCLSLGDASQVAWLDAPEWQRASAIEGVEFHLANPDAGDDASHNNWMEHKLADGWTYGEIKDPEKKTHPCLVAFKDLPPAQQFKDTLFRTLVHAVAAALSGVSAAHVAATADAAPDADTEQLKARLAQLEGENAELAATVAAFDEVAAKRHRKGDRQVKARKLGPVKAKADENAAAIAEAMAGGAELELAFGHEGDEVIQFEPVRVFAGAFQRQGGSEPRFVLRDPVSVRGGSADLTVDGVALLEAGKQVAWCAFRHPVAVPAGQERRFDRTIVFA